MLSDCILWPKSWHKRGYGQRYYKGRQWYAHRAAWDEQRGPIPKGMCVLHKCDNPRCVNIEHLWIGTMADNQRDMAQKKRSMLGERHPGAKLTGKQVKEIRASKLSGKELGVKYAVTRDAIYAVKKYRNWKHIR